MDDESLPHIAIYFIPWDLSRVDIRFHPFLNLIKLLVPLLKLSFKHPLLFFQLRRMLLVDNVNLLGELI